MVAKNSNQVLWKSIFVALLFHIALIFCIKITYAPHASFSAPQFNVIIAKPRVETPKYLIPQKNEKIELLTKKNATPQENKPTLINATKYSHSQIEILTVPNLIADKQGTHPISNYREEPESNIQQILDQANKIAREDARQMEKGGTQYPSRHIEEQNNQNKLTAAIGHAFKQENLSAKQKEVQYANGMVEVTTLYGTKYCASPPKDFQRGGPVEAMSMPMTCP